MNLLKDLKQLKCGKVENIMLKNYTTYKVGGKAVMIVPEDTKRLIKVIKYLNDNKIKFKILGNGSNLIFGSDGYDGVIIKLSEFKNLKISGTTVTVGAGYSLIRLSNKMCNLGFVGLDFATGIPGTVGGAVYMNAGAYKSDMGYIVKQVTVITPDLKIKELSNSEMEFHYRTSYLKKNPGYIVLKAVIELKKGNKNEIMDIISDRKKRRLESQPLEYPSAGSVFRNPTNLFAGKLIEDIGYKGHQIGDACVSSKHANFIINKGHATGKDIISLIDEIKDKVEEKYGIELVLEQEIVK